MRFRSLYGILAAGLIPVICPASGSSAAEKLSPERCMALFKDSKSDPVWRRMAFRRLLEQEKNHGAIHNNVGHFLLKHDVGLLSKVTSCFFAISMPSTAKCLFLPFWIVCLATDAFGELLHLRSM